VLMIAPQPFFQPRGTPISVYHRAVALGRLGAQVDLLTYPIGDTPEIPGVTIHRAAPKGLFDNVKIGPSFKKLPLDLGLFVLALRFLSSRTYDVVHTHEEAGIFYAMVSGLFKVPHLYDMHSSLPQQFANFDAFNIAPVVGIFRRLEQLTLDRSAALITICSDLEDTVKALKPDRKQVMIENFVDNLTAFGRDESADREIETRWASANEKTVLYTGTLEPYQGLDLLIKGAPRVLEKVPEARFLIVGGKPEQIAMYREMARGFGVQGKFHFTGQVPPHHVAAYVNLAQVLVSPRSSGTNTPLKIYCFLGCGVPVVATRMYTHTQVLDENNAFLADPEPDAFADGIVSALTDEDRRARVLAAAKAKSDAEYSYDRYLDKVLTVYRHVLGPERVPGGEED